MISLGGVVSSTAFRVGFARDKFFVLTGIVGWVIVNSEMTEPKRSILYTIGHSNHTIEDFIGLLKGYGVTCIADIRSAPYSRYCPQFNKDTLAVALQAAGIMYMFLGRELGARPDDPSCYEGGRVNFQHIAKREEFERGLERLLAGTSKYRIALMCAEKDPLQCHRTILVVKHIKRHNLCIKHILANGNIEDNIEAERRLVRMLKVEPTLFESTKKETDIIEQAYDHQAQKISYQSEELKKSYEGAE